MVPPDEVLAVNVLEIVVLFWLHWMATVATPECAGRSVPVLVKAAQV